MQEGNLFREKGMNERKRNINLREEVKGETFSFIFSSCYRRYPQILAQEIPECTGTCPVANNCFKGKKKKAYLFVPLSGKATSKKEKKGGRSGTWASKDKSETSKTHVHPLQLLPGALRANSRGGRSAGESLFTSISQLAAWRGGGEGGSISKPVVARMTEPAPRLPHSLRT